MCPEILNISLGLLSLGGRIVDPANTNNVISEMLSKKEKEIIAKKAKEVKAEIAELNQMKLSLLDDVRSLEERKDDFEKLLNQDEESIKKKIESKLFQLKLEKPELFTVIKEEPIKLAQYLREDKIYEPFLGSSI